MEDREIKVQARCPLCKVHHVVTVNVENTTADIEIFHDVFRDDECPDCKESNDGKDTTKNH